MQDAYTHAEQGIEQLSQLEELSVRDNALIDISALASLTALRELHLDVNAIASLDVSCPNASQIS